MRTSPSRPNGAASSAPADATPSSPARDVAGVVAVYAVSVAIMLASDEPGARPPDALGLIALALVGLPLLARRRWPSWALAGTVVASFAYHAPGYPGGADLPLILLGVYSVSAVGLRVPAAVLAGTWVALGSAYRLFVAAQNIVPVAMTVVLLGLVGLLGDLVHTRRQLRAEVRERLRAAAAEQQLETDRRLTEERLRIAHELHDVMAHTITTMTVQVGAAADLLPRLPEQATTVLRQARQAARDAMAELRATITVLRADGEAPRRPAPGLAQLDELVRRVEAAGVRVHLDAPQDLPPLPQAVELTAYRVAQEGLTNVLRHSDAQRARLRLLLRAGALEVCVEDDGTPPRPDATRPHTAGYGLVGLGERVHALGGSVTAAPRREGGFTLRAAIPVPQDVR